jgi:hypothetical protein
MPSVFGQLKKPLERVMCGELLLDIIDATRAPCILPEIVKLTDGAARRMSTEELR